MMVLSTQWFRPIAVRTNGLQVQYWSLLPSPTCTDCILNASSDSLFLHSHWGIYCSEAVPQLHTYINSYIMYTAVFLAGRVEVVWQLCGCFLLHTNLCFQSHQQSLCPSTAKSCHPSNSLSLLPIRSTAHSVSHCFPADSTAVNGSYSQYGLMKGVSS